MMRQLSRAGLLPAFAFIALAASMPQAAAQLNGLQQQFEDIRGAFGFARPRPPMDFTERPPLVVPPNDSLPPPGSGQVLLGVNDPDVNERRKALTDPRRPVPPSDPGATAAGLSARPYLIDPPSGLRDPSTLGPEPGVVTRTGAVEKSTHHHRRAQRRTPAPVAEAQ